jgi:hypothetical protein
LYKESKDWLLIGVPENWATALSQPVPIWGLKPRYQTEFQSLHIGDVLWFYSTNPVKGVIGIGVVKDKYIDHRTFIWAEEFAKKEVIWPLRFRIHALKILPNSLWRKNRIKINDFNLFWQSGFHALKHEYVIELENRSKMVFGIIDKNNIFSGSSIAESEFVAEETEKYDVKIVQSNKPHRDLQEQIAEIGKLQYYYTEFEYPIELPKERKNIDVVWKREMSGVPTFAFEIELSGMIERAVDRLKFAYQNYNSRPRLIIPNEKMSRVQDILSSDRTDFRKGLKIYEPNQIKQLLETKRQLKNLEQSLELY